MSRLINFQEKFNLEPDGILGPISLKKMQSVFGLCINEHMAHFMGELAHESGNFKREIESLNYDVAGLMRTFGRHRISKEDCHSYGRKPGQPANQVAIANIVYGGEWGRKNLGNTQPGDGFKFKGHGPCQTTGRHNFYLLSVFLKDPDIMNCPILVNEKYYFESALFFFNHNNIWKHCNQMNDKAVLTVARAINIGNPYSTGIPNGMQDRREKSFLYYKWLCAN